MPHQCVRCGKVYEDGTPNLLKGCQDCGSKFFFFMKKTTIEQAKKISESFSPEERIAAEQDIKKLLSQEEEEPETSIFLDIENIRVSKPGKFEIDLIDMFKGKPLVCKVGEGKYIIDLISTFKSLGKK